MNNKTLRNREIRLSLVQAVILVGVVTGSMACAFYLGFQTGRSAGYSAAMEAKMAMLPRLPLRESARQTGADEKLLSEVYAKLNDTDRLLIGDSGDKAGRPAIEPIGAGGGGDLAMALKATAGGSSPAAAEESAPVSETQVEAAVQSPAQPPLETPSLAAPVLAQSDKSKEPGPLTLGSFRQTGEQAGEKAPPADSVKKDEIKEPPQIAPTAGADPQEGAAGKPPAQDAEIKGGQVIGAGKLAKEASVEKKAEPTPTHAASSSSSSGVVATSRLPVGWFAQVAAPERLSDAEAVAGRLKAAGFPAMVEKAVVRGQQYFRVVVGPEKKREQADLLVEQLKRERAVSGAPFVKQVK